MLLSQELIIHSGKGKYFGFQKKYLYTGSERFYTEKIKREQ
jgi:hypothetical protein